MLRIGLIVSLLGCVVACGADAGDGALGRKEQNVGEEKSVMITAAEGGELAVGAAALTIPKGALSADTEISVKVESKAGRPDEENVLIEVYDFGPDGLTFATPVTLAFDVADVNVSDKGKAMIAWQNGDKWETLPTKIQDGKATAETTHFTPFTLVFVLNDDGDVVQAGGQCGAGFDACGGDLVGTWTFTGACMTAPEDVFGGSDSGDNPFAMCSEQPSASVTLDLTGTATFGADGSFNVDQTAYVSFSVRVPQSCLEDLAEANMGVTPKCEDVGIPTAADGNGCLSEEEEAPEQQTTVGTYTVEGSTFVVTEEGDVADPNDEPDPVSFCVNGDTLTVHIADESDGSVVEYTATRN